MPQLELVRNKALFVYKNISRVKGIGILLKNSISRDSNIKKAAFSGLRMLLKY